MYRVGFAHQSIAKWFILPLVGKAYTTNCPQHQYSYNLVIPILDLWNSIMSQSVEISFDCIPLRSVARFDIAVDATPEQKAFEERIRSAVKRHGQYNTFYLCNAKCVFHLTNHSQLGMLKFDFEGTAMTDEEDRKTIACDLSVELDQEVCDWLTAPIVEWFKETVAEAVKVEFDRYIEAGGLQKTIERIERLQAESAAHGGFLGMGL
jgi:hypothetical protein